MQVILTKHFIDQFKKRSNEQNFWDNLKEFVINKFLYLIDEYIKWNNEIQCKMTYNLRYKLSCKKENFIFIKNNTYYKLITYTIHDVHWFNLKKKENKKTFLKQRRSHWVKKT